MAHLLPPAGTVTMKHESFMFNKVCASNYFHRDTSGGIPPNIHDYKWTDYKELDRRCKVRDAAIEADKQKKSNSMSVPRSKFNPTGPCPATVREQRLIAPCPCPQHRGVGHRGGKDCACVADGGHVEGYDGVYHGLSHGSHNYPHHHRSRGGGHGSGYFAGVGQGDGVGVHGGGWDSHHKGVAYPGQSQYGTPPGSHPPIMADQGWGYCPPIGLDPRCLVRPRNKGLRSSIRPTGDPYFAQEAKSSCLEPHAPPTLHRSGFTFDDWLQTVDQRTPPAALRQACVLSIHYQHCSTPVREECTRPWAYSFVPHGYY